jgi:glycine/D-amino acid oxidase-like deaminating enzyme
MRQSEQIEVLIVGAGPTGLALAYQLRRLGVSFRIIEKNPTPSTTSKAIGLQYRVLQATDQTSNIMLAHSPAAQLLRDRVVLPLLRSRAIQRRMTRRLSQLDFNYRGLSLSAQQEAGLFGRARVRAGDRTPDVLFRDARTGEQTSLFAHLGSSRLIALVGPGQAGEQPGRITRLLDALGRLAAGAVERAFAPEKPRVPSTALSSGSGAGQR